MHPVPNEAPGFTAPPLRLLGLDLLASSPWQKTVAIARPFICFAAAWVAALAGWWPASLAAIAALMFVTYASTSHDYVHRTLGLPRVLNESLLAVTEGLCLRCGHAFRLTHLQHHRHFPDHEDIESHGATTSLGRALLAGPGSQTRYWRWAWQHARPDEKRWLRAEIGFVVLAWAAAFACAATRLSVLPLAYCATVTLAAWLYPAATVWWPHHHPGPEPHQQTRRMRGRWMAALLLHHNFHLEHHLYPSVPAHNWRKLAARLDPYLDAAGVPVQRLP